MSDAIVLRGVTKTFGSTIAVRDLDLVIPQGAICGFIGPNGAGKTTTLRIILSILFPDRGELSVLGRSSAVEAKDRIGYLPEERGLYKKMRVGAFIAYLARLKGHRGGGLVDLVRSWLDRVGIPETYDKRCDELSKGMQQKVQFIAAMVHHPDLLILDEPFSGLDPVSTRLMRDLVMEQHRLGTTVLFSTHVMAQAEAICDRVVMIHDGAKVLDTSLVEMRRHLDPRTIHFEPLELDASIEPLSALPGVEGLSRDGTGWTLRLSPGVNPNAVMREVLQAVPAASIELCRPTLEDVFVELVTRADGSAGITALRASLRAAEEASH